MSELLFEIGAEEIPAGYIIPALDYLKQAAGKKFKQLGLQFKAIRTVGTPRRLTLIVEELQSGQEDRRQEHVGPAVKAGYDQDGNPTRAAAGFAKSKGVAVQDLEVVATAKGDYLMAVEEVCGRKTSDLLPAVLEELIQGIPFPKSMRWADSTLSFARPIQWLLALYDGAVIDFSIESVVSGNTTRGHRFMSSGPLVVDNFEHYSSELLKNFVMADQRQRRKAVIAEVEKAVQRAGQPGARPVLDEGLLDTVTNLVEIPFGVCGSFDEKFLDLPNEALITSMREHQKYFPVVSAEGRLLPFFVAVNNTDIKDKALAVSGHERVLRARLEDGLFFYEKDSNTKLADRYQDLAGIIFQHQLGSMLEKANRIERLTEILVSELLPGQEEKGISAARLAKIDLLTEMVGEFPSLQGVMGREYALKDGEDSEVATAIYEHYLPVRAGGKLPTTLLGAIVGLADRIDTVAGCFAIGQKPTGTTDPFGLRRLSLGILHILRGMNISLSLRSLVERAIAGYSGVVEIPEDTVELVLEFIRLRFENDMVAGGIKLEVVQAATSVSYDDVLETSVRIKALGAICSKEQFSVLAGSFKRIRNIIKDNRTSQVDVTYLTESAEKDLYQTLEEVRGTALPLIESQQYEEALEVMLQMKEPLDRFFDEVMVMADDQAVRRNRLNLLTGLGDLVLKIGDISRMHRGD